VNKYRDLEQSWTAIGIQRATLRNIMSQVTISSNAFEICSPPSGLARVNWVYYRNSKIPFVADRVTSLLHSQGIFCLIVGRFARRLHGDNAGVDDLDIIPPQQWQPALEILHKNYLCEPGKIASSKRAVFQSGVLSAIQCPLLVSNTYLAKY